MNYKNLSIILIGGLALSLILWKSFAGENRSDQDLLVSPQEGPFEVVVTTTGELRAKNSIEIMGPMKARRLGLYSMKIDKIVPEGTRVDSGQMVAELDKKDLHAEIKENKLKLDKARSEFESVKLDTALTLSAERNKLVNLQFDLEEYLTEIEQSKFESPAIQRQIQLKYDRAKRSYDQDKSNFEKQVAKAVANVTVAASEFQREQKLHNDLLALEEEFFIRAPSPGMVVYVREWNGRKQGIGSKISSYYPIVAKLPDLSVMESVTYVNEIDIRKIRKGQNVAVGFDAIPDKVLKGTVMEVANMGEQRPNSDSKVFEVIVQIQDADTMLRPAMTTSNNIMIQKEQHALYLPLECLHGQDSVSFVFSRHQGKIIRKEVETGLVNENHVQILSGLLPEDQIYISMPEDTAGLAMVQLANKDTRLSLQPSQK